MGQSVGTRVEIMIVVGFVDAHSPKNNRGMVPVAPDHTPDVINRKLLPGFVANMLPSGNLFQHEESHFIAAVEKGARLWIVRWANSIAMHLVAEYLSITPLHSARHART